VVVTSFVEDKKGRKGLLTGVWKSEYIWEAPDLESVMGAWPVKGCVGFRKPMRGWSGDRTEFLLDPVWSWG